MANFSPPPRLPPARAPSSLPSGRVPQSAPPFSTPLTPHSFLRPIKTPTSSLVKTPLSWRRQKGNNCEEGEVRTSGKNYPVLASSSPLNQGLEPAQPKTFSRFCASRVLLSLHRAFFFFFLIRKSEETFRYQGARTGAKEIKIKIN